MLCFVIIFKSNWYCLRVRDSWPIKYEEFFLLDKEFFRKIDFLKEIALWNGSDFLRALILSTLHFHDYEIDFKPFKEGVKELSINFSQTNNKTTGTTFNHLFSLHSPDFS